MDVSLRLAAMSATLAGGRGALAELPVIPLDLECFAARTYPTPFVHVERWSQVWGLLPVSYQRHSRRWGLSTPLTLWVLCSVGLNVPCFVECTYTYTAAGGGLALYCIMLIVVVMSTSAVATHVMTLVLHAEWATFLDAWMAFERKYPTLTRGSHSQRLSVPLFCCILACVAFFILNILNELRFNLIHDEGALRMLSLVYVYIIYSYTLSMPVLWVVMASKVFTHCLTHIRHELESLKESGGREGQSFMGRRGDIHHLHDALLDLHRLLRLFKIVMGPFMLVIVIHHVISLICFLYWTLVSVLDYDDWYSPVSFGLLSAQAIAPIFIAAIYSEDIQTENNNLIKPLIILKGTMKERQAKIKMESLISHVRRMDAQIEGRGFFVLNKSMATSVVNTVVTYLVVLIQFYGSGSH